MEGRTKVENLFEVDPYYYKQCGPLWDSPLFLADLHLFLVL